MKRVILIATLALTSHAFALTMPVQTSEQLTGANQTEVIESSVTEFDPWAADAEQQLEEYDQAVEAEGGSNWIGPKRTFLDELMLEVGGGCTSNCPVVARISLDNQVMILSVEGQVSRFATSTGVGGRTSPWSGHPNGRIYTEYTSKKHPGGDFNGLGNMPYAVFLHDGIAIHGTPRGNWGRLGTKASHGCIRIHPTNAQYFNSVVRRYGTRNVWVSIY